MAVVQIAYTVVPQNRNVQNLPRPAAQIGVTKSDFYRAMLPSKSAVMRQCLFSTIPLPFCSFAVPLPMQVRTEMLETSFHVHRDEVTRALIGCPPTAERQK